MRVSRRTLIASLAAAPAAALSSKTVFAADYPDRPIHLIVPFAPGGNADIVGRIAGQLMGDGLKGTVVVENHDGAGGSVGAAYVAHATPDGYTLLVGSNGPLTINPILHAASRLRSAEGFRGGRADELRAARAHHEHQERRENAGRRDRDEQEGAGHCGDKRRRQRHAYDARTAQGGNRRGFHARPLSAAAAH